MPIDLQCLLVHPLHRPTDVEVDSPGGRDVVEGTGRTRIELIDVLAHARTEVTADLLVVRFVDGSSLALLMRGLHWDGREHFVVDVAGSSGTMNVHWGTAPERGCVATVETMMFAAFVSRP